MPGWLVCAMIVALMILDVLIVLSMFWWWR
ncbi:hypothetical protein ABH975_003468 [Bradyrhizobium ottawaense]